MGSTSTGDKPLGGSKLAGADAPELDELARRLLDLWQDQLTAVAANPDLATQAARLMAAMPLPGMWLNQLGQMGGGQMGVGGQETDMTKVWAKMAQDWMAQDWFKGAQSGRSGEPTAKSAAAAVQTGTAAAAAASGSGGRDLDELSRRLAGIEQRLGELAQQSGQLKSPGFKSAESKSKPAARRKAPAGKPRRTRAADPEGGSGGADGGASG